MPLREDIRTLRSQRVGNIEEEDELMSSNDNMSLMDRVRKHLAGVDIVDASPATRATAAHGPSPLARHMTATPSTNDVTSCSSVNAEQPYIALVRQPATADSSGASDQSKTSTNSSTQLCADTGRRTSVTNTTRNKCAVTVAKENT